MRRLYYYSESAGKRKKVFLAGLNSEVDAYSEQLKIVLEKAGMDVLPQVDFGEDSDAYITSVQKSIAEADFSIHILGKSYGGIFNNEENISLCKFQYLVAKKRVSKDPEGFKMFIWYPPDVLIADKDPAQENFINEIRNGLVKNMIFTTAASPFKLVEEIRSFISFKEAAKIDVKETEVFLIFNFLDETEANDIVDLLSDIVDVEKLNIVQDSEIDYSQLVVNQIEKSKLAVVYFKDSADWAMSFTQQVWKKVGGASSHTPILLIGDENPEISLEGMFSAPKVISLIVKNDLIPLEIKVQYDKVLEIAE